MKILPSLIVLIACWSTVLHAQIDLSPDVTVARDIEYANAGGHSLLLDVYWHAEATEPEPLVIWIHGGAWRKGSKNNPRAAARLLEHGYAVASINYRLSDKATFPAQIQDCKAAIRWLRANANRFNIDGERVGVWGSSAGGHLCALVGTSWHVSEWETVGDYPNVSSKVQAVCDFYGPTDFLRMDDRPGRMTHNDPDSPESSLIGGAIQENKAKSQAANPINYIVDDTPPFLIMHGKEDVLVLWEQSQMLHDALQAKGQASELILYDELGHGGKGWSDLFERPLAFFNRTLKGEGSN